MKNRLFLSKKNLFKKITFFSSLFFAIIIISSSTISLTINNVSKDSEMEPTISIKTSNGLAPNRDIKNSMFTFSSANNKANNDNNDIPTVTLPLSDYMWGYIANSSIYNQGPCYFPLDDPETISFLKLTSSNDFLSGGTIICEKWIACENSTGALWEIDFDTGNMTYIGGGGVGLNGLACNPINRDLFGASGTSLYLIDQYDGTQEFIGFFGSSVNEMIGIACTLDGICYGWDLGDKLWVIDIETGEATEIAALDIDLNYAQDGHFDWTTSILWLTAYTISPNIGSYLYYCDVETGECTLIGQIEGNTQITASALSHFFCPQLDIGVASINYPHSGYAEENISMQVKVKNYDLFNALTDIYMEVTKHDAGGQTILEYAEVIEDVEIESYSEVTVDFPPWTPTFWHDPNYVDTWQEYKVKACTLLNDDEPENDCKEKEIDLYFPFFHDVGVTNVSSPVSGPAQSYPVKGVIKNFGQYDECCFKTYVEIKEVDIDNPSELLIQDFSDSTFPPTGWTKTHDNWMYSNTKFAGGKRGEARFTYAPSSTDLFRLYSPIIDTSDCEVIEIEFKHRVSHNLTPYTLQIETSSDGINWDVLWFINPMNNIYSETISLITNENLGSTTYVSWTFNGSSKNIYNWYVDDIKINGYSLLESEYLDYICTMGIDSGEEQIFEFDEWTPEFLAEETTGIKKYMVNAWTKMDEPEDENPDNDLFTKSVVLDFFHDVGIDEIISPSDDFNGKGDLLWDNGEPDGRNGLLGSMYSGYSNILIDDFENKEEWIADGVHFRFVWDSGYYPGNMEKVMVYFFEETGQCEPYLNEYAALEAKSFDEWTTGDFYFGRPEIACDVYFDDIVLLPDKWWVGFQPDGIIEDKAYLLTSESKRCMIMADLPYLDYPRWTNSMSIWGEKYDLAWMLDGAAICHPPVIWIQPGTQDIEAIAKNYGTFQETDLTCFARIYEYYTCPENGTLVYKDNITNINLEEPLNGTELLSFNDFTFLIEGRYRLYIDILDEDDDYLLNNKKILCIFVDDTPPHSNHSLEPQNPDGKNDWYINDIKVLLTASDPASNNVSSGVKEIRYTINGGVEQVIPGWQGGSFVLTEDGENIVIEYWAVDNVGNVETKKSFVINLDKTKPDIYLEWDFYKEDDSWTVKFTCYATDALSKIDRVEMYINDELYATNAGPPYEFIIKWSRELKNSQFKFVAYDIAGNSDFKMINGHEIKSHPRIQIRNNQQLINLLYLRLLERFKYTFLIFRYFSRWILL